MNTCNLDYFSILGLSKGASLEDVKRAFRRLAKIYHPDVNGGGDAEVFIRVSKAYKSLIEDFKDKRVIYENDKKKRGFLVKKILSFKTFNRFFHLTNASRKIDPKVLSLNIEELFARYTFSDNPYVRFEAAKAIFLRDKFRFLKILKEDPRLAKEVIKRICEGEKI